MAGAVGGISSSARQRKLKKATDNQRRAQSARNFGTGNNNRAKPPKIQRSNSSEGPLTASMPTIFDSSLKNVLDDSIKSTKSMKSNPELYLRHSGTSNGSLQRLSENGSGGGEGTSSSYIVPAATTAISKSGGGNRDEEVDDVNGQISYKSGVEQGLVGQVSVVKNNQTEALERKVSQDDDDPFQDNDPNGVQPINSHHPKYLPKFLHPVNDARRYMGKVINNHHVQNIVLLLIVVNAIMMGVATFPAIKYDPQIITKFETADQIFLILFTIESGMQLGYHGWTLFKDGFLVFDLLIVVMSWALEGAQVFRAFRILRAVRLITRIDTLKNLVLALFSVVPKMTAIFMLLALIFYIFAVMFTQLFKGMYKDGEVSEPYFDSLPDSFFTLFQMMTLDNWADILFQIQIFYSWAWVPFVTFIIITGFVVVNLIIAVICDAVHVLGNSDKAGLEGYDSEGGSGGENSFEHISPETAPYTTEGRLQELQLQLDEMVLVQDQMRKTIEVLIKQLQGSDASEYRTSLPPTEQIRPEHRSRTGDPIRDAVDEGGELEGALTM